MSATSYTLDDYLAEIGWTGTEDRLGRSPSQIINDILQFGIDGGDFGYDETEVGQFFDSFAPPDTSPPVTRNGMGTDGGQVTADTDPPADPPTDPPTDPPADPPADPIDDFDYDAFRALLSGLYDDVLAGQERPVVTPGGRGLQIARSEPGRYLSDEMRGGLGLPTRMVDYGAPTARSALDLGALAAPRRTRPLSVRPRR